MRTIKLLLLTFFSISLFSQGVPYGINYQAIARDGGGMPIPNVSINAEINLLQGSASGTLVYSETHSTNTNQFGLYNFIIGDGNSTNDLSSIDWQSDDYFIESIISVDGGSDLQSVSKINSVPYSFLSYRSVIDEVDDADNDQTNELQDLGLSGSQLSISNGNSVDLSALMGAGGTDDQTITQLELNGSVLTVSIEDGNTTTVDLSSLMGTAATQDLTLVGTQLMISGGQGVDLSSLLGTDNQMITDFSLSGNTINLSLEDGGTGSIDLSSILSVGGSDDQMITDFSLNGTTLNITLEDGGTGAVDLAGILPSAGTDDQMVTDFSLNGASLSITLENGGTATVDLSSLLGSMGTDDQEITDLSITGTQLSISIEDGGTQTLDLGVLQDGIGSDDQMITDFSLNGTELNIALEDGGTSTVDLVGILPPGGTDDQMIMDFSINGNTLNISLENGGTASVDLSGLQDGTGTDDQMLTDVSLNGNELSVSLEDGGTQSVDLSLLQDGTGTDDQMITDFSLNGTELNLTLEDGGTSMVDLANILPSGGTDDQMITDLSLSGSILNITLENGGSATVNLSTLQDGTGTDDQMITDFSLSGSTINLSLEDGGSGAIDLAGLIPAGGTDDQMITNFSLSGTTLNIALEDGGTANVDLNSLQDGIGTDDQVISASLNGTALTISLENGGSQIIDLSGLSSSSSIWQRSSTNNNDIFYDGEDVDVDGISLNIRNDLNNRIVNSYEGGTTGGGTTKYNSQFGELIVGIGAVQNRPDQGLLEIYEDGDSRVRLSVDDNNAGKISLTQGVNEILSLESINQRGSILLNDEFGRNRLLINTDNSGQGTLTFGPSGGVAARLGNLIGYPDHGLVTVGSNDNIRGLIVEDANGNGLFQLLDANGFNRVEAYANGFGPGSYLAVNGVKNFKMDHPNDETKEIWYACIEGPEAAAYERGTSELINGEAFVPFTDHFELVINPETMTVNLTPNSANTYGLAVVEKTPKGIFVKELMNGKSNFSFDWEVKAVRKGFEDMPVVRNKINNVIEMPKVPKFENDASKIPSLETPKNIGNDKK